MQALLQTDTSLHKCADLLRAAAIHFFCPPAGKSGPQLCVDEGGGPSRGEQTDHRVLIPP